MRQKRLLLLLVLLLTATTGAWAQDAKHLITATYDKQTRSLEQPLPYATTIGELYEAVTGESFSDLLTTMTAVGMPLTGIGSNNTSVVSIGELNGASTPVTVNADGKATVGLNFSGYVRGSYVSVVPPLYAYMKDGVKDADKWTVKVGDGQAQALPISGLKGDGSETITLKYNGRLKVKGVKATSEAAPTGKTVDLSTLTADYVAQNGDVLTGETSSYEVTIAAGATVTLDGVTINGSSYCIKCAGDATIILKDGSTNTLTNTGGDYPALSIGDANTTLTIQGSTGVLNVSSGMYCAGIGGGYSNTNSTCGNIRIEGGVITAKGGDSGAGIGTDAGPATCGDIIITGGTITAKGGSQAAGIGNGVSDSGGPAVCGDITIANTVTKVTATKGANAPHSIGKGNGSGCTCGTVTIGGTKYWENNAAVNGGDTYLAQSPLIYDPTAQAEETGLLSGVFSVSASKKVNFSKGNLRYESSKWSFFDNQYDRYTSHSEDAWDHFGWSTSTTTYGMSTSTSLIGDYSGDFVDWGATMGTGWFTLSKDEWKYLFNTRSASTVGGTENARYAKAKVNGVQGVILFPDTYTHPDGVTAPVGVNATGNTGWNGNSYTVADWTKMESAGCVFLPAAGYRGGSEMVSPATLGYYWSATPSSTLNTYSVYFSSSSLNPAYSNNRYYGYSVRLVQEVAPNP